MLHARGTQHRVIAKMAISSQELSPDCNLSSHLAIMATGSGIPGSMLHVTGYKEGQYSDVFRVVARNVLKERRRLIKL